MFVSFSIGDISNNVAFSMRLTCKPHGIAPSEKSLYDRAHILEWHFNDQQPNLLWFINDSDLIKEYAGEFLVLCNILKSVASIYPMEITFIDARTVATVTASFIFDNRWWLKKCVFIVFGGIYPAIVISNRLIAIEHWVLLWIVLSCIAPDKIENSELAENLFRLM